MKKIVITEHDAFNKLYTDGNLPCRMTITLKNGEQKTAQLDNPTGHHRRPMSDEQLMQKFRGLAGRKLTAAQMQKVVDRVWKIDSDANWPMLFADMRVAT
jgi:2-methylcitrate dehydratase PrpD